MLVRAPNPSPMTLTGTNSYLVEAGDAAAIVIDPGPAIERHVDALLRAARERKRTITAIAVTHGHPDHAPASVALARATGAPIYTHFRSSVPHDRDLPLEAEWRIGTRALRVIDAPGHTFDHVIFYDEGTRTLFTGDTILGQGTVVIAPPGGAMRPYQQTLERLARDFSEARTILGGHGPPVTGAQAKIAEYIAHRKHRESELIVALAQGKQTIPQLVVRIYSQTPPQLHPAAARQLLAYLEALIAEGRVRAVPADRELTVEESALLNPSWDSLVDAELARVVEAELGTSYRIDKLICYSLSSRA